MRLHGARILIGGCGINWNGRMLKAQELPQKTGTQFAVAVFDNWDALNATLIGLEAESPMRTGGVLHARTDVPAQATGLRFLRQMTKIRFAYSRQELACTVGRLAEELSARLAQGARSLGDALDRSLNSGNARQLESHIDRGHLVLWVELHSSDEFSEVCGRLVQASPHMVSLCGITDGASAQG
jgi:hypothetical protein